MTFLSALLTAGYLIFGRTFAYLGVLPFYPAEVYLLLAACLSPAHWVRLFAVEFLSGRAVAWWLMLFLGWGIAEVARGVYDGRDAVTALKGFSAHYYPLLFVIGAALGRRLDRVWLQRYFLLVGALAAINGIAYAAYTSKLGAFLPWAPAVAVFDVPAMVSYLTVGLLAFAPQLGARGTVCLVLTVIAALATPGRALWLSIIAGCATVLAVQRNWRLMRRLAAAFAVVVLVVVLVGDLIPASEERGGSIGIRWIAAQVIATFDPDLAYDLVAGSGQSGDAMIVYSRHGTISWRYALWSYIVDSLSTPGLWLFGHGYGVELAGLAIQEEGLRSTHNFILYLLVYTGLVGLVLYLGFSASLVAMFARLPASPVRAFLFGQFVTVWVLALFGNTLETPFAAVPFYLLMGIAYGISVREAGLGGPLYDERNFVRGAAPPWLDAAPGGRSAPYRPDAL